jgi:hypothetical protein
LRIRPQRGLAPASVGALVGAGLVCFELFGLTPSPDQLIPRRIAGEFRVAAPRLHFLTGKSLQRLQDGAVVPFDFQLTIAADSKNNVIARSLERFSVSYDVWQEKFSVVRLRDFRKSKLYLSANAAEAWCLDNISLPAAQLPAGRPLWARLEIRSAEPHEQTAQASEPGFSIATLIEIFSRTPRSQQDHWATESAAFHFADLRPADLKP